MRKSRALFWGLICAALVTLVAATSAQAGLTVSQGYIDADTGGDWRGTYGECFYLIPHPEPVEVEIPVGPAPFSENHEQYEKTNCYGGPLFDNNPDKSRIDWRIFLAGDEAAFAWRFGPTFPTPDGAAQWNPCLDDFRHATWDNDRFINDPLSVEITVFAGGSMTLAYYFTDGVNICRDTDWALIINGSVVQEGTITDFAAGKYLVFEIDGLVENPDGTTILLEGRDAPAPPVCAQPAEFDGVNTQISGVFINGTSVCAEPTCGDGIVDEDLGETCDPPGQPEGQPNECRDDCTFCGDGFTDPGEDCDDGGNEDGDGCSATCTDEPMGEFQACTPGYWKQPHHYFAWNIYTPQDSYDEVFDIMAGFGDKMLGRVVAQGGGGEKALGRHAVAGLLNAASGDVNYPFSVPDVIALVQGAYASGEFERVKNVLAGANEDYPCPLGNGRRGHVITKQGPERSSETGSSRKTTLPDSNPGVTDLRRD